MSQYAFFLGMGTVALGGIFGKLWSPDYYEQCASGGFHYLLLAFVAIAIIIMLLIDWKSAKRGSHRSKVRRTTGDSK